MGSYVIAERNLPHDIPVIDEDNMGIHIMWMYHNGYKNRAITEMIVLLENYIKQLIKECSQPYRQTITPEDYNDLYQECCEELMNKMQDYNAELSKPTTYFTMYIKYKIYIWLGDRYQQISPYYAKKAAKIAKAINDCSQNNVSYNESKLAAMTELSPHTVHNTLQIMNKKTDYSYEDLNNEFTYKCTPEDVYLEKEESHILSEAFNLLSDLEKRFFYLKVFCENENGKPITYKQIAQITGYSISFVKRTLNQTRLKLAESEIIKSNYSERYYERAHRIKRKQLIIIPEDSSDIQEQQIIDSLISE